MGHHKWITTAAGVKMPRIIYGTAWKKERTADLVVKAVQTGFRGIDTAGQPRHYNESQVGDAILRLQARGIQRKDVYLQTKFTPLSGQDPNRLPYDPHAPVDRQVAQSFEISRMNLKTDHVDTLVLHSPLSPHAELMTAWQAMEKIQRDGGARQLGISNCYHPAVLRSLYEDASVKPAVVQNRFYRETGYDAALRGWCSEHGIVYQSFWTLTANPHILRHPAVDAVAREHNKTAAQIFFRYLTQSDIVPLTGTTSERHMAEDLAIFSFELSAGEMKAIHPLMAQP